MSSGDRGCIRTAPRGDDINLTDSFRCVDAVTAPLRRILVEVFHLLVAFSIVDWIVDQLLEWHQVQAL